MSKLFYSIILFSSFINAQNKEFEISKYVEGKIVTNLAKIPIGKESLFGFESRNNFDKCIVGNPIKILTLDKNNSLVELNEWRIPIKLDGINKVLFTVIESDESFKIIDIGGHKLANELQTFETTHGLNQCILRLYNLHCDFIVDYSIITNLEQTKIFPLESAKIFLEKHLTIEGSKPSFSLEQIIEFNKLNME